MSRLRISLLSLLAVFAIGAVVASAASAEGWTVPCHKVLVAGSGEWNKIGTSGKCEEAGGSKEYTEKLLAGEKAEFSELPANAVTTSKIVLAGITISCKGLSFTAAGSPEEPTESFIEGTNGGHIKKLVFTECKVTNPASCHIVGETITTNEITLALNSTSTEVEFKETVSPFAEFEFKVETGCKTLSGKKVKVTGHTIGAISNPSVCEENHVLTINEKPSTLKAAGAAVEEFVQTIQLEGVENLNGVPSEDECWDA